MRAALDLIAIGRVSVDLYGQQIGSRLEDVATFAKAVGGCPANVAVGVARLGLRSALISRVGDEPMGRFVLEQLRREGVETAGVSVDPQRLTALVLLGIRSESSFPLIFYRDNCADAALSEADVSEELLASSRAVLVTGTHFSTPHSAAAQAKAIAIARRLGRAVILDVDYRPNLWGIGGHGAGESRYARSQRVTAALAPHLALCDVIVGTEEELHVAAGVEDTLQACRLIRERSAAVIVCKRGAQGCVVFSGTIPATLDGGISAPGMQVEVYNVLGAGDAFLAGFLRGFLRNEPLQTCVRFANACGAFAVSRLLCSSEYPTMPELEAFLERGSQHHALRRDARLNHLHWVTTRPPAPGQLMLLGSAADMHASAQQRAQLRRLMIQAVSQASQGQPGFGLLVDGSPSIDPSAAADGEGGPWMARTVEWPGRRALDFADADSLATHLTEWPTRLRVSCRCLYHPDDPPTLRQTQERELLRLAAVCRAQQRELLLQVIVGESGSLAEETCASVLSKLYALGIRPDYWGLEPLPTARAWQLCGDILRREDSYCHGMLMLLPGTSAGEPGQSMRQASREPLVRGFVTGQETVRRIAPDYLQGRRSEDNVIAVVAEHLREMARMWSSVRRDQGKEPTRPMS